MDSFRRIDIDKYDEDVLLDEELIEQDPRSPTELAGLAQKKAGEVRSLVGRGDAKGALTLLLAEAPYGELNVDAKQTTLSSLLDILNATRSSDIATIVKQLSLDEQDTLMKYIYKGLSVPELGASPVLLGWHEKLTEVAGTGCIVRVMTDRRRV
ncbi:ARP2/3 complex 16 kDa subunit (p16-Arc) [Acaromyces ingoldii]|uniref:Actin-related protein 2/3 complex subunit 5 n=1 Tax=Acaromyces ingoldii TaxID=215250 RepID=A0A316YE84_9BASI|nr:ARP2/3 complex 16 kDa subunit (p16-Arc) [Acaromyces ingoldii]PWN87174.1 ARP2/3 complex 16 kDa subunit (p16-Arc) [Acaromyces ingoldii]